MNWVHKYKPRKFDDVIEQEHIIEILDKIKTLSLLFLDILMLQELIFFIITQN